MKKKIILITVFIVMIGLSLSAQGFDMSKVKYGASTLLSKPTGDFGDMSSMGFGLNGFADYPVNEKICATASLGYAMWSPKDEYEDFDYKWSCIPIKGGAKYKFQGTDFYGIFELGMYMFKVEMSYSYFNPYTEQNETISDDSSESEIGFAPGVGYKKALSNGKSLDIKVQYESAGDLSWIGINGGIRF